MTLQLNQKVKYYLGGTLPLVKHKANEKISLETATLCRRSLSSLSLKRFRLHLKWKKGLNYKTGRKKNRKKNENKHTDGTTKKEKKETNKQKIKQIKWINEKHKHEKNFHFVIMKSTYIIL